MAVLDVLVVFLSQLLAISDSQIHVTSSTNVFTPVPAIDLRHQQSVSFHVKSANGPKMALQTFHNSEDLMYIVYIGGWTNWKSMIRREEGGTNLVAHQESVLNETEYRPFWVSWMEGVIAVGKGTEVGSDVMMTWTDPSPRAVNYLSVCTGWASSSEWIIDTPACENMNMKFELSETVGFVSASDPRMLSLTEVAVTQLDCSSSCFYLVWCRSFSYKATQQECRMFDTPPSGLNTSDETGWKTWAVTPMSQ